MNDQHVQVWHHRRAITQARLVERLRRDHDGTYATAVAIQKAEQKLRARRDLVAPPRLAAINPHHR
jgi:hypothetical protein